MAVSPRGSLRGLLGVSLREPLLGRPLAASPRGSPRTSLDGISEYRLISTPLSSTFHRALKQAGDFAMLVNVDLLSSRALGKTWHSHNIACERHNKARARRNTKIAYSHIKVRRRTE